MTLTQLYLDTRRVLDGWAAPDDEQRRTLARFQQLFADVADPTRRDNLGAHITASTVVVSADLDQVLLCLHGRVHKWLQLGGHCEPQDTSLAGAARREATEESGMDGLDLLPDPIDLNIHPVPCRIGPSLHYDVRFVARAPVGAVPVLSEESLRLAWFTPDALPSPLTEETRRLIDAAFNQLTDTGRRPGS